MTARPGRAWGVAAEHGLHRIRARHTPLAGSLGGARLYDGGRRLRFLDLVRTPYSVYDLPG